MTSPRRLMVLFAGLVLTGCPAFFSAPFDATGVYEGRWNGSIEGTAAQGIGCTVEFDLTQNVHTSLWANFPVEGTMRMNFTCPAVFDTAADAGVPAVVVADVIGAVTLEKDLYLETRNATEDSAVVLTINGEGVDFDEDGVMDGLAGDFTLRVRVAGSQVVTIAGTLEAGELE